MDCLILKRNKFRTKTLQQQGAELKHSGRVDLVTMVPVYLKEGIFKVPGDL